MTGYRLAWYIWMYTYLVSAFGLTINEVPRSSAKGLPGMAKFCRKRTDGKLYPDPDDCRAYIYCSGGYAYRAQCGKGLYYNQASAACDYDHGSCSGQYLPKKYSHTDHSTQKTYSAGTTKEPVHTSRSQSKRAQQRAVENTIVNKETPSLNVDSFCQGRKDGTHPHPYDCHSYLVCSNGYAFPVTCPKGLVFMPNGRGCDFDRGNTCSTRSKIPAATKVTARKPFRHQSNHVSPPRSYRPSNNMAMAMPEAVEQAMGSLMKVLKYESDLAHTFKGSHRPFRLVQKFLRAKPLAKQLGMANFIITNASKILIEELGMMNSHDKMDRLKAMGSPLSANIYRLKPDEKFPAPEPDSCPWPKYTCSRSKYRSQDGSCNNLYHPLWGRSFTPLKRFLPADYSDGIQGLRASRDGRKLPSARRVSHTIVQDMDRPHSFHTAILFQWGQFVDHDLTLTAISQIPVDADGMGDTVDIECGDDGCEETIDACVPIKIEHGDPDFRNQKCLEFVRSQGVPNLECSMGPREQLNQLTAYLDGSNIYGSTMEEVMRLRNMSDPRRGRLRYSVHPRRLKNLLPTTTEDRECNEFQQRPCFLAGDERVNEQNALTVMHTLWMREHNFVEWGLHSVNMNWSGERLFQEARKIIGAMIQQITYGEFLPLVLGPVAMRRHGLRLLRKGFYTGYDGNTDASIATEFSTAAYRFGHTLLIPEFHRINAQSRNTGSIKLSQMFFRPNNLMDSQHDGVDGFLRGLCQRNIQNFDRFVTKEVSSKLFSEHPPNGLGHDLVTLNIMRARDHGITGYNSYREWCGLHRARDFDDLVDIPDVAVRNKFRKLYRHVDDIDLFPAGIAERSVDGGLVGPTFACIIGRQFGQIRKGDRFWYENSGAQGFTAAQLKEIRKVTLASVMCRNGDNVQELQPSILELPFRSAYPSPPEAGQNGLNTEWLNILWHSNYNHPVNCSCMPTIDWEHWRGT